ncbi:MAG: hypothetical protein KAV82_14305 [Phycisphaerae bacterium]|nr:hypothetical protein [Phycisphaerae bacterium]
MHGTGCSGRVGGASRSEVEPTNQRGGFRLAPRGYTHPTFGGWLAACVVVFGMVGCGAPATDGTGGAEGVVTLGPRIMGGNAPTSGDQADNTSPPADGDGGAGNGTSDGSEPSDGDGGEAVDGSEGGTDDTTGDVADTSDTPDWADGFDACAAVDGRAFVAANASLSFVGGQFICTVSGEQTVGTFTCTGLQLNGTTIDGDPVSGSYDPIQDVVLWQGLIYRPPQPR